MKKQSTPFITLITLLIFTAGFTQEKYSFEKYDWDNDPKAVSIPVPYQNENEVLIEQNIKIELAVDGNETRQYYLLHEKKYINSDDAIERNNKIYLPFQIDETVITNKARVILKSGKIINLDQQDIKEEVDQERGIKLNYFAVHGLEKGSVIETIFLLQEYPDLDGNTIPMQLEIPIINLSFELIYPEHLEFKTKSYNGLGEPTIDSEKLSKRKVLTLTDKDVVALKADEKYSNYKANVRTFRYKLDKNLYTGGRNLYNFKELATNFYARMNVEQDKKQLKAIDDFCKTIPKSDDLQEQIWNVENKIKKTFSYNRYLDAKPALSDILKAKQANEADLLKLYLAVFRNLKIENEVVLTSERDQVIFDKDFESYENLKEILLFFPAIKMYMALTEVEYRIPLFPRQLGNNYGLFVKEKIFAGIPMGIGDIEFIVLPGVEVSHDVMEITIDFRKDIASPTITNKMSFGGYSAMNFQPLKDFTSPEQYQTILKSIAENYTVQTEYQTLTTAHDGTDFIGKKPFLLTVTFNGADLIQKAGDNYLFSVGQTIGSQMELYQENKRKLPVEIEYPHYYERKITILLPAGATVKNTEKLNMDVRTQLDGKDEAVFISTFNKEADVLTINNTEYYKAMNYPLDKFDSYKDVINAAADFNKLVIIISK